MPIINVRNDQQAEILSGEFVRKADHLHAYPNLFNLLNSWGGIREAWLLNSLMRDGSGYLAIPGIKYGASPSTNAQQLGVTTMSGALAAVLGSASAQMQYPNGWGGCLRIGSAGGQGLWAINLPWDNPGGNEPEVYSASRGISFFAHVFLPSSYNVPPTGGNIQTVISKWTAAPGRAYAVAIEWQTITAPGGELCISLALSTNGTDYQVWYFPDLKVQANRPYLIGACFVPSVGCYGYLNEDYQFKANSDYSSWGTYTPPASIYTASTTRFCVGRRDDNPPTNLFHDGYWNFLGLRVNKTLPNEWIALYRSIQPTFSYATDLGGW